ncbi:MAG TPA: sulfurtransferase TusA family protein [Thermoplasmata archaeon]
MSTMDDKGERFPQPAKTLDCIGLYCPEPVFRTREEISSVPVGQILEVLADDPASESDITSWAKHAEQELLLVERRKEGFRFLIRRKK